MKGGGEIEAEGGEVLKFMGDGVLFIIADDGNPTQTCDRALRSVEALTKAIDQHNASTDGLPIRFGCALHYGAVLYGNIGSPARLDFTVVGSAVNLTARLESLTSKVGEVCLVSQDFSDLTSMETRRVGEFELKGLSEPQAAYAPLLTTRDVEFYLEAYLGEGGESTMFSAPLLAADLSGLPPALLLAVECDPLRDDAVTYHDRLLQAGTDSCLHIGEGLVHGCMRAIDTSPGVQAMYQEIVRFITRVTA